MHAASSQLSAIAQAAEILGEPWTILILRELLSGASRFSDVQRALTQISPSLLTKRLNKLVRSGLVERRPSAGTRVEYSLTPPGQDLRSVLCGLGTWGLKWARGRMNDDEHGVESLLSDLCRRIDETQLPDRRTVIGFSFPRPLTFPQWWLIIEKGRQREVCFNHPRTRIDLHLRTDVQTLHEIGRHQLELRVALKQGRLQLSGDPRLIRTLPNWLYPATVVHLPPAGGATCGSEWSAAVQSSVN